jgi:hypothetical protein
MREQAKQEDNSHTNLRKFLRPTQVHAGTCYCFSPLRGWESRRFEERFWMVKSHSLIGPSNIRSPTVSDRRTFDAGSIDKILCSPKLEIQSCYYHFIDQIFLV